MSAQQKTRQTHSQTKEQGSKLQTGTWSKVFPKQHHTETTSCTFVKKLMAVAISNITYLRSIFPENAFSNQNLDGLPLKILKENTGCETSTNLVNWLRGAFEALEKRYLRELMLIIYLDPKNPNEVYEMYTFRFGYSGGDRAECQLLQGKDQKQVHVVTDENLYNATHIMLRSIITLVQGLGPLPENAYMTMKLTYYDDITPIDYEPQGFCPTEWTSPQLSAGTVNIKSGEVSTNFHTLKLSVKAVPMEITVTKSQETGDKIAAIANSFSESESELEENPKELDQQQKSGYISKKDHGTSTVKLPVMSDVKNVVSVLSNNVADADTIEESVSLLNGNTEYQENNIKCICQNSHQDNLMLVCTVCKTFQHGACFKIIFQSDIPESHICVTCSLEDGKLVCTDRKLAKNALKASDVSRLSTTCVFRRALATLINVKIVTIPYLQETLGIDEEYAEGIIGKLIMDKIVVESLSGEHLVDEKVLQQSSFPKYLGIKRYVDLKEHGDHELNLNEQKNIEKENLNKDTGKIEYKTDEEDETKTNIKEEKISDSTKRSKVRKLRSDSLGKLKEFESKPTSSKRSKRSKEKTSTVEETDQLI